MFTAVDKRLLMTDQRFLSQKSYWEKKLTGDVTPLLSSFQAGRSDGDGKQQYRIPINLSREVCDKLLHLSKSSDLTIYIVLLTTLKTLLYRYFNGGTVSSVSPVYKPNVTGQTLNDFVIIVDQIDNVNTYKDLLLQVTQSVREAYENQDYPFSELAASPIQSVDIACLYKNIHDPGTIKSSTGTVVFSFERDAALISGSVTFNSSIYESYYIKQLSRHFIKTLDVVMTDIGIPLPTINFLSEEEKTRLLYDFNDTKTSYPANTTIHELFERQVRETPDKTAVICLERGSASRIIESVTYRELNEISDRLGGILSRKGVIVDSIVAIMVEPSAAMIYGILGILKAGGGYLPIAPDYPEERKRYILEDSRANVLVTNCILHEDGKAVDSWVGETIHLDNIEANSSSPLTGAGASDIAYVIYTSGSTGNPRGVMVEHKNVVRLVKNTGFIEFNCKDRLLRTGALEFDASTFEIWGTLLNGLTLYSAAREDIINPGRLKEIIRVNRIDTMWLTAPLFNRLSSEDVEIFDGLRNLIVGGDALSPSHINRVRRRFSSLNLINGYGPTENTTFSTTFPIHGEYENNIPIGEPISNSTAFILGKYDALLPIGVPGELVVSGDGVARGYLNNPELTAEKFFRSNRYSGLYRVNTFYRTGDLARRLPNGNIEFLGRLDNQVKIRGFRIELGEIEHCLLKHESVAEAMVVCREKNGDKQLCAYVVGTGDLIDFSLLKEHLAGRLPPFMIPTYFAAVDSFPLNRNGKVDVHALPEPGADTASDGFIAPRTGIEKTLVSIWSEVLDIPGESIGIDANFFELGGHSLKISILITRIHKAFNVKIELADVFMIQTIRELAEYIEGAEIDLYTAIEPAPEKDYYILSSAQKRLYFLNRKAPDDTGYNMPLVLKLNGSVSREKLEEVFRKLIYRHESLRTAFIMIDGAPMQQIFPDVDFQIEYYDLAGEIRSETEWQPHIVEILHDFVKPFDLSLAPLLRVGLIKESEQCCTMIVDIHHIISDGTSHEILAHEFGAFYSGRELQSLRLQYKDYSVWQNDFLLSETVLKQKEYWLNRFSDSIPRLNLPLDYPRPVYRDSTGIRILTEIPELLVWKIKRLALNFDTTLYIVLLAAYTLLISKISGQDDIIVGSPVSGRTHADLHHIIGLFANMLPMRNKPREDKIFSDFLMEVKENALRAFENQDFQFDQLVNCLKIERYPGRHPLFDTVLALHNIGSSREVRKNPETLGNFNVVPFPYRQLDIQHDLLIMVEERGGKLDILLEYAVALFKPETISEIWNHFLDILEQIGDSENFQSPLKDFCLSHDAVIISHKNEEEGDFNF